MGQVVLVFESVEQSGSIRSLNLNLTHYQLLIGLKMSSEPSTAIKAVTGLTLNPSPTGWIRICWAIVGLVYQKERIRAAQNNPFTNQVKLSSLEPKPKIFKGKRSA